MLTSLPEPPPAVGLQQGFLNRLLGAVRGNRVFFNRQHFESRVTRQGTEASVRTSVGLGSKVPRWFTSPVFTAGGSYDGKVTVEEGTLFYPSNEGTNNTAGDPDPDVTYMLPNPHAVWSFASPFPVEVSVAIGEEVFIELHWTLRVEELGTNNTQGADSTLVTFWELTDAFLAGGVRTQPSYDYALGTAITRMPIASIVDDNGAPRVVPYFRGDMQAVLPILPERSLVSNVNGGGGGGSNSNNPTATVTVENAVGGGVHGTWLTQANSSGSGCTTVHEAKRDLHYLAKRFTFDNGVVTQEALVSELYMTSPGALLPVGKFEDCDPQIF